MAAVPAKRLQMFCAAMFVHITDTLALEHCGRDSERAL
jgi:hypothetical protein